MAGKIIKIGTWENGFPCGWSFDGENKVNAIAYTIEDNQKLYFGNVAGDEVDNCLEVSNDKVYVNGVEIVEWTEDRRKSLNEGRIE